MTVWRDLRHGVRLLAAAPGFTVLATVVFALGIGATSTIFSLLDAALLRPLPFHEPATLVMLSEAAPGYAYNRVAPLNFVDWSEQNRTFTAMAAVSGAFKTLSTSDGIPERIPGQAVTTAFFDVLGVRPIAGRTFVRDDGRTGARVVVLSERLWRNRFGAEPGLIGRTIPLDGEPHTVVGIVPATFQILFPSDMWLVFKPERGPEQRQMHYLQVVGRLKPGISIDQARGDMATIAAGIARISPSTNKGWGVTVRPLHESLVGNDLKTTALVLAGVVGFVLLMACANVANLLLARGVGRTRELAVRAALGASRPQLLRQLLTESLVLAALGGTLGLALAAATLRSAPVFLPPGTLPDGIALSLDWRVTLFAAVITVGAGIVAGLAPAWHAAEIPLTTAATSGTRTTTGRTGKVRAALAVVEIAVAVVLMAGAGLLVRSLVSLNRVDAGYRNDNVLTMIVVLPMNRYPSDERRIGFFDAAVREIEASPGAMSASFGGSLPLDGWDIGQAFSIVGDPTGDPANMPAAHYQITGPRFFETLGIPIVRGRAFTPADTTTSPPVCIVNEAFVRRYARGRDPLQLQVRVDAMSPQGPTPVTRQVVGVAGTVKESPADDGSSVQIYVPLKQNSWYWSSLVVRTAGSPAAMINAVKAAVARVDKNQAVGQVRTMDEVAAEATAQPRFRAELVSLFAALALVVATVGVAGVLAFSVQQRTRELGLRMALGARQMDIVRLVLSDGLRIAGVGLMAGLGGAFALTRFLESLLFGVTPLDVTTFAVVAGVLGLAALTASAAPALRAARADPAVALRSE
jgi:putative ABC transport system permease protein